MNINQARVIMQTAKELFNYKKSYAVNLKEKILMPLELKETKTEMHAEQQCNNLAGRKQSKETHAEMQAEKQFKNIACRNQSK